jgi:hypothetical protein
VTMLQQNGIDISMEGKGLLTRQHFHRTILVLDYIFK